MDETTKPAKALGLSDYLYIIYKWKRFFLFSMFIVLGLTTLIVFLLPVSYKATAVVMIPPDNSGFGGLSTLIGGGKNSTLSMGAKLFGVTSTSEDMILGLLNSRTALSQVLEKYKLANYYEVKDNFDKLLRSFKADLLFEPNAYGMIEINVNNENPKTAAEIANYFTNLLDSLNIKISSETARNNRVFIEKRYLKNVGDLQNAEDSMFRFQKKYGIFAVPQQLEVAVKAAAEVERELTAKEIAAHFAELQFGKNSPQHKMVLEEVRILKGKVIELKNADKLSETTNVLFPFSKIPQMTLQYYRIFREIEIQSSIMEIILPMYEQAKVEENKSIPTITIIDKAYPPTLKDKPKRLMMIIGIGSLFFFVTTLIILRGEIATSRLNHANRYELKEHKIFSKLKLLFKIEN